MVYSKLDSDLFYPNIKTIYPEDKKKKSSIYEFGGRQINRSK